MRLIVEELTCQPDSSYPAGRGKICMSAIQPVSGKAWKNIHICHTASTQQGMEENMHASHTYNRYPADSERTYVTFQQPHEIYVLRHGIPDIYSAVTSWMENLFLLM